MKTLLIILIVVVVLIGLFLLFIYSLFTAFKPQTPDSQLKEFSANLLEYEFGDGYEIVDSKSRNNHPDRPQDLKIKLSDEEFNRLKVHIDSLPEGETRTQKGKYGYVKSIIKRNDGCSIKHSSIQLNIDYTFYTATAIVDYTAKTVTFHSTFY